MHRICCFWSKSFLRSSFFFQIETIELPIDPKSKKRRGFIFITYKEETSVKKCLEKKYHNIQGGRVSSYSRSADVQLEISLNSSNQLPGGQCSLTCDLFWWRVTKIKPLQINLLQTDVWPSQVNAWDVFEIYNFEFSLYTHGKWVTL